MNMVRCMLKCKKLPKSLWGEAVLTAVHILNRSPTKRLQDLTLEEAWSGSRPSVSHFRVFGSVCYKYVPDQLRKKLDDKSEVMILVGYHSTGGYRLLNPETKQIVTSRDVVIDEAREWDWSAQEKNSVHMQLDLTGSMMSEPVPDPVAGDVRRSQRETSTTEIAGL